MSILVAAMPYASVFFGAGNIFARSFLNDFGGFFVLLTPISLIIFALGVRYSWHVYVLKESAPASLLQPVIPSSIIGNTLLMVGILVKSIVYTAVAAFVGFFAMVMAGFASDAGPNIFSSILFFAGLMLPGATLLLSIFWSRNR